MSELIERDCKACHPCFDTCPACGGTGKITSPGGIITSKELIAMGEHPDVKAAIAPKSRFT